MAFEFKLPDIGEGVAEGEVVRWFVAEGDVVERDQPMVEVLTDKANVEIPAPRAGTILRIVAREGQIVPVESTLVIIGDAGESLAAPAGQPDEGAASEAAPAAEPERVPRAEGSGAAAGAARTAKGAKTGGRAGRAVARAGGTGPQRDVLRPEADPGGPGTQAEDAPEPVKQALREQPKAPATPPRRSQGEGDGAGNGGGRDKRERAAAETSDSQVRRPQRISPHDKVLAMPAVRRFAREQGVDLREVTGSGSHGHVLRADVERHLARDRTAQARTTDAAQRSGDRTAIGEREEARALPAAERQPVARRALAGPEEEVVPYRGVRRQIGRKMAQSVYTAPHYTYVEEVDADALVRVRRESQGFAEERGVKLTYLPFIMKALVPCLRAYPLLNAVLDVEGQQIRLKKRYNLGLATSSEEGLIVPVVKDVDQLSILEIAHEIRRLSEAARDRSITIEELKGSTFTITSLGAMGGLLATPIINFPEVAILGVHAIKQKPVVKDGQVVVGNVMNVSLSFDHRVVDGAVGAEFTRMLVRYLEAPQLLLLES